MTYKRFEDLPVRKTAMELAVGVYALVEEGVFRGKGDLADQLRRASLSISSNIAEGFERGTTAELLAFLYIARGSAGETRSQLRFCEIYPAMAHLRAQVGGLIKVAESVSRQLQAWADSLQNSEIPGQRRMTEETRAAFEAKRRSEAFLEKLREMNKHLNVREPES